MTGVNFTEISRTVCDSKGYTLYGRLLSIRAALESVGSVFYRYHDTASIVGRRNVCSAIPFHGTGIAFPAIFGMGRQPLGMEDGKLLLESLHTASEMYLQPFAAGNAEEAHSFGYLSAFVSSTDDIGEFLMVTATEVHFTASGAVMVG